MSIFDDILVADAAAFTNPDEFGECIVFKQVANGGQRYDLDAIVTRNPPMKAGAGGGAGRLMTAETVVSFAKTEFPTKPVLDADTITLDGETKERTVVKLLHESDAGMWHCVVA